MNNRPLSAAASIYPHLPHDKEPVRPQRQQPGLADALYPSLVPKPKPPSDPYLAYMEKLGFRVDDRQGRRR
jgi:hypothetical protein